MTKTVTVVGGGLAGLTAAIHAARGGAQVRLLERVSELGGRARTRDEQGFRFNMGPHALYRSAEGMAILDELGLEIAGAVPPLRGAGARFGGRVHSLPGGFVSLLTTGFLGAAEKLETGRFLASLGKLDPADFAGLTLEEMLAQQVKHPRVRQLVAAIVRLSTYAHAPDRMCAAAAVQQVQRAFAGGVIYPHDGWSQIVDTLRAEAVRSHVEIRTGDGVRAVIPHDGGFSLSFHHADVPADDCDAVVLAVSPAECARLLAEAGPAGRQAEEWARTLVPIRASSLELALAKLPRPRRSFCLGIDEATYFSVHSATARLAPGEGAVIHCTRYLSPDESPARDVLEKELESVVDDMQPGWREHVIDARLLTDLTVSHGMVTRGGFETRPPVQVAGVPGLLVAGDWVGREGLIADAAFASGREAGRCAAGTEAAIT